MTSLSVFDFEGRQVRFVGTIENPEWVAADITDVLEVDRTQIRRLEDYQKGKASVMTKGGRQVVSTVNLHGLKALVATSRSPKAREIAQAMGFDVYVSPIESDCIRILEASFSELDPMRQFKIGPYRIDLYLHKARIAIECDEGGHPFYDARDEKKRQLFIIETLDCQILRFNPDEQGFNIGCVIWQIRKMLGLPEGSN
jgi:very-short-patch-repair endonuclease